MFQTSLNDEIKQWDISFCWGAQYYRESHIRRQLYTAWEDLIQRCYVIQTLCHWEKILHQNKLREERCIFLHVSRLFRPSSWIGHCGRPYILVSRQHSEQEYLNSRAFSFPPFVPSCLSMVPFVFKAGLLPPVNTWRCPYSHTRNMLYWSPRHVSNEPSWWD